MLFPSFITAFILIQIEYTVEACANDANNKACVESRRISVVMPTGGDVIYGVAHQHTGGVGSALYGEVLSIFL